ncbi:type IIL restriction-modification enzyme MmeI [Methylicorpusculum sp.]|uniref:type IIL restriction-modification enzyme MmeI n=1 Tax=Methylicorpusculum sp. TaxID=2713644 RepID=UPI00351E20E1
MFGVPRKRVATFEKRVKKLDGRDGYIDLLWKGILLVEHKSRGKDLLTKQRTIFPASRIEIRPDIFWFPTSSGSDSMTLRKTSNTTSP